MMKKNLRHTLAQGYIQNVEKKKESKQKEKKNGGLT